MCVTNPFLHSFCLAWYLSDELARVIEELLYWYVYCFFFFFLLLNYTHYIE